MLSLVRATRHCQRSFLIADRNVQVEPSRHEQLTDGSIGTDRAEVLCLHGLGTVVEEHAHQLDRALPCRRAQEPSTGGTHLSSVLE
jgi:hypothetical protein